MTNKGFTLIELLVTISIIGLLSTVVTTSTVTSRNKAVDSKVSQTFINIRTQSEIMKENENAFCSNAVVNSLFGSVGGECYNSGNIWAIYSPLKNPSSGKTGLCIDSTGLKQQVNHTNFMCNPTSCIIGGGCMPP